MYTTQPCEMSQAAQCLQSRRCRRTSTAPVGPAAAESTRLKRAVSPAAVQDDHSCDDASRADSARPPYASASSTSSSHTTSTCNTQQQTTACETHSQRQMRRVDMLLGQKVCSASLRNLRAVWLGTCSVRFPVPASATLPRQSAGRSDR